MYFIAEEEKYLFEKTIIPFIQNYSMGTLSHFQFETAENSQRTKIPFDWVSIMIVVGVVKRLTKECELWKRQVAFSWK